MHSTQTALTVQSSIMASGASGRAPSSTGRRPIRVPDPLPHPATITSSPLNEDDSNLERLETPPTPMLVLRPDASPSPSSPDTEDNVARQTRGMFGTFVVEMEGRQQASMRDAVDTGAAGPPSADVLGGNGVGVASMFPDDGLLPMTAATRTGVEVPDELMTTEMRVGRQLAIIADDVNARYSNEFNKMVHQLRVDEYTAYDAFAAVARQLFGDGVINWGRIIVLLCFGYRVVVAAVRGCRHLFGQFFGYVIDFIIREKIASWVAAQGGWVAALRYIPESIGLRTIGVIFGVAAVCVAAAIYLTKNH